MITKITQLVLALLLIPFIASASHGTGKFVPPLNDPTGESAADMYAKKLNSVFTVLDCNQGQLLWKAAQDVALVWENISPVQISVQLDTSRCVGAYGNSINEIYWDQKSVEDQLVIGNYQFIYDEEIREILEEDFSVNINLVSLKATTQQTSTLIVVYNAVMHLMGNSIGLAGIQDLYPEECSWSVMLATCHKSRLPPQEADLAAINHIFFSRDEISLPGIEHSFNAVSDFDTNLDNKIDEEEFESAMILWTLGSLDDDLFQMIFEFWMSQNEINPVESERQIEHASLFIFDTDGTLVQHRSCTYSPKRQLFRSLQKTDLPVGIYIARIKDCDTGRIEVRMIAKTP
jgi:hypothetical protein